MAIITTDLQLVSANSTADSLTGYTAIGATANVLDSDAKVHNNACVRNNNITTIFPANSGTALNAFTAVNLTNKALYLWRSNAMPTNLAVKNQYAGCAFWVSSGATYNTSPYKVFDLDGQDTDLTGGWKSYAVDPTRSTALQLGSLTTSSVTSIGFSRSMLTSLTNAGLDYIDVTRYGTGLKLKDNSAVSGQQANFSELFTYDSTITRALGVLTSIGGVYYGMGKLLIGGDDAVYPTTVDNQAALTYFKDTEQTLVWKSMPLNADFYELRVASNASQDTVFQLGSYNAVSEVATEGVTIKGSIDTGAMASAQQTPGTLTAQSMFVTAGTRLGAGQAFRNLVVGAKLKEVSFWMAKTGTPTSTLTAKLYAHSGTFGTSSIPTGTALATSDPISASVVATTQGFIKFTFSGAQQFAMADNTDYVIAVEISGATSNSTNFVSVYSNASNTYPGNWASWSGTAWTATATTDIAFKLYTINPASTWKFSAVNTNATNVIKLYGSTFENVFTAELNGNLRSRQVALCGLNGSTTVTTSNNFTSGFIVPGMEVSGTGITAGTRVASIESNTSLTLTDAATTTDTVTLTFVDRSEIISCKFNGIGAITANGCYIHDTIFENVVTTAPTSATNALIIANPAQIANVSSCQFINCNRAIRITQPGTYVFDNLIFTGNVYDIENTSAGLVTVTLLNGSNATTSINTGGGTTVINTPRTFSVTNMIDGSAVRIVRQSNMSVLAEADSVGAVPDGIFNIEVVSDPLNAGRYIAKYQYNYTTNTPVFVVITNNNYQAIYTTSELVNDDSSLQISQVIDRQYINPA